MPDFSERIPAAIAKGKRELRVQGDYARWHSESGFHILTADEVELADRLWETNGHAGVECGDSGCAQCAAQCVLEAYTEKVEALP